MCGLGVVVVSPRKQESCQATSIIWDFHIEPQLRVMGAGQEELSPLAAGQAWAPNEDT